MSQLTENPDLMLEVIAKLVHRLGGSVTVRAEDTPTGAYNLMSKFDDKALHLVLEDDPLAVAAVLEQHGSE